MDFIHYLQALEIILANAQSFGKEIIDLDDSLNRVIGENVFADRDYPPFNRSAMDGIAIDSKDVENNITQFTIIQTIYAGEACDLILKPGQCFKIMTGAAVPLCADAVIRVEDIELNQNTASILVNDVKKFQNIATQGQDIKNGELAIPIGTKIKPTVIGLLASLGKSKVQINKMPTVAIITTGGEVKPIDETVCDVQIRNSNLHVIKSLLKQNNIEPLYCQHIIDNEKLLEAGIKNYLDVDILILCGGVSAGDADFVPSVLSSLGVQKLFHKVAIKPGKPIWCGKKPKGAMVFALPGNPFSCLVTFTIFIQAFIHKAVGLPQNVHKILPLNNQRSQKTKFDEFFPVIINYENQTLNSVAINGSGDIRLGLQANGLALHPAAKGDLDMGEILGYWDM
ncbi:MAG: molybdopterin molybdenumtransferase MoeA [Sphingobacteriales bacterium]|nr:MAG: molybdopterin molybdenumtransferase MoeA [Sphingobacteriales bacterium]TAF81280.1 MAG: molybdopterin molybdenumtransferase MoeA [Sphingobacteriales bacterium]